jgi:hypothetical protein
MLCHTGVHARGQGSHIARPTLLPIHRCRCHPSTGAAGGSTSRVQQWESGDGAFGDANAENRAAISKWLPQPVPVYICRTLCLALCRRVCISPQKRSVQIPRIHQQRRARAERLQRARHRLDDQSPSSRCVRVCVGVRACVRACVRVRGTRGHMSDKFRARRKRREKIRRSSPHRRTHYA